MSIEEINTDREKFMSLINKNVAEEINKIGLELINVNIRDITDESGYIEAIGKRAAAEAIQRAIVEVAEQERDGATGQVLNQGTLTAAPGGYIALLGASVSNEGKIYAPQGNVALGAADVITLPMTGTGRISSTGLRFMNMRTRAKGFILTGRARSLITGAMR
jgi:hypothetical protein